MSSLNIQAPVLLTCGLLLSSPVLAQDFPVRHCHLESKLKNKISASFTFEVNAPELIAKEWIFYFPAPPDLSGQQKLEGEEFLLDKQSFPFKVIYELSPQKRTVGLARIAARTSAVQKQLNARTNYVLTLYTKELIGGAGPIAEPLAPKEQEENLISSTTLDFESQAFQDWLRNNELLRNPSERDLDYAWRCCLKIRKLYDYSYDPNQKRMISYLCKTNSSDCGGLSFLFVGALRANKIPARALIGRWLKENGEEDSPQNGYGNCHVKAEFFAENIGWVPVEVSRLVSQKNEPALNYFGKFQGNFVVFHTNPDLLLDSFWFGKKEFRHLQSPIYWVTGGGSLNNNSVRKYWQTRI